MKQTNWYVITGGPCSGKTTVVEILKKKGYKTATEIGRHYIASRLTSGETIEQINADPAKKQEDIFQLHVRQEATLPENEHIFFDRALPDVLAYHDFYDASVPSHMIEAYKNSKYRMIFYFEQLPMKNDSVRVESDEDAKAIASYIYKRYKALGIPMVTVPVMDIDARVKFVLKHIHQGDHK
ncbi:MAG TPA: ATP-binding protein [Candidatus Saccharimonadales bacterium]|nr:ATP-binding protein [Candidatus Saccharimonadales bacterium]